MSRIKTEMARSSASSLTRASVQTKKESGATKRDGGEPGTWIARALLVVCAASLAAAWQPFGLSRSTAAAVGILAAILLTLAEIRFRQAEFAKIVGGAVGLLAGILAALMASVLISRTSESDPTKSFLSYGILLGFGYLGAILGASKGGELVFETSQRISSGISQPQEATGGPKLLDTSVLIDGRIADICEAQFLDGPLEVPQFVLHELQQIADSSDTLRRQRGRRGLEVLQRIQKMTHLGVKVLEDDGAAEGEVDRRLVELARKIGAKIVTNDFNLNKVASVQGIAVLNVNQLANALRPAVLPGESMRVFVLREGKEANQGVAYLEDGTMVVVDGAKRFMNKNIDIIVTSVHQTPAGKMIFGRLEEQQGGAPPLTRQAAAGRAENGGRNSDPSKSDLP